MALAALVAAPLAHAQPYQAEGGDIATINAEADLDAAFDRADRLFEAAEIDGALATVRAAIEEAESRLGSDNRVVLTARSDLAGVLQNLGRLDEAELMFARNLAIVREPFGENDYLAIDARKGLANLQALRGNFAEALAQFAELESILRADPSADTAQFVSVLVSHGTMLRETGALEKALATHQEASDLAFAAFGEGSDPWLEATASHALTLSTNGQLLRAVELFDDVLPGIRASFGEDHPFHVQAMVSQVTALLQIGRLEQAEELQLEALQLAEIVLDPSHQASVEALSNYAMVLRETGRSQRAVGLMQTALDRQVAARGSEHPLTQQLRQNLGVIWQDLEQTDEARKLYAESLASLRRIRGDAHPMTLLAANNVAAAELEAGNYSEAERMLSEAYDASAAALGERHPSSLMLLANAAMALEQLGGERVGEAAAVHGRNVQLRREVQGDLHPLTLLSSTNFANFHLIFSGRPDLAYVPARFAVRGWRQRRDMAGDDPRSAAARERNQVTNGYAYYALLNAAWAALAIHPEEAATYREETLATMQDVLAGSADRAISQSAARRAAGGEVSGAADYIRQRQQQNADWLEREHELTGLLGEDNDAARARREELRAEMDQIEGGMEALDTLLRYWAPEYTQLIRPDSLTIAETQALLGEDEAAVLLVPTDMGTHAVAITRDGFAWHRSDWDEGNVDYAVRRIQYDLGLPTAADLIEDNRWADQSEDNGPYAYSFWAAYGLFEELLAPLAGQLEGKSHVFVMSSGALTGLPLGLLVDELPPEDLPMLEALHSASWLADRHAFVTVPNLQSIRFLRQQASGPGERDVPFLGFGNPELEGAPANRGDLRRSGDFAEIFEVGSTRGGRGVADLTQLRALSSLPGTERELTALWQAFGQPSNALFLAEAASESAVKQADLTADVIVFATHGLLATEAGTAGEPGLVMTPPDAASVEDDGYLSMSEIAELEVDADWVILSACNTAGGSGTDSSGLSGLASAFFFAGAENLLVSHWPVDDDVAARLTVRTVELSRDHPELSRAQAFQQAMAEIRNDPDHPEWAHPVAWAPFVLVGDR